MAVRQQYRINRVSTGSSLVELLIAVTLSGIVMVTLGASLSEQMRLSTTSQNQLIAGTLAREVVERVRATPFAELPPVGSIQEIRIASGDTKDTGVYDLSRPILARPLQIDAENFSWRHPDPNYPIPLTRFPGRVTLQMGGEAQSPSGPIPETKTATVSVTWTEGAPKQLQLKAIICRYGIQMER